MTSHILNKSLKALGAALQLTEQYFAMLRATHIKENFEISVCRRMYFGVQTGQHLFAIFKYCSPCVVLNGYNAMK